MICSNKSVNPLQLTNRKKKNDSGETRVKPLRGIRQNRLNLNNPILIAGFPGPGLVGSISTSHIIEQLHMHHIACVESEFIAPGVIYIAGKIRHPFRLYSNEDRNICVLVCEAPIMIHGIHSVLDTVVKWAKDNEVRGVIVLEGIPVEGIPDSSRRPMILSSEEGREVDNDSFSQDDTEDKKASSSSYTTFIAGISGGLLSSCLSNGIPCKALLISASSGIPDPEGAAILIESLSNIVENDIFKRIDAQQLRERGANLKRRMAETIRAVREQQSRQQQQEKSPTEGQLIYG